MPDAKPSGHDWDNPRPPGAPAARDKAAARAAAVAAVVAAVAEADADRLAVDLTIIAGTFARALEVGAPGLSETTRRAIVNSALIRLRHTLKPAVRR